MSARRKKWRTVPCSNCDGKGVVSVYTLGGTDFDGPGECRDCSGGVQYVTRTGRLVQYPGGPFCGRLSAGELAAVVQ